MLKQFNKKYRHGPSTLPPCIMRRHYFLKDSFNTQSNSQKTHTQKNKKNKNKTKKQQKQCQSFVLMDKLAKMKLNLKFIC